MKFEDKFIAFVDILGFKGLVKEAEAGVGLSLSQLMDIQGKLGCGKDSDKYAKYGHATCPESEFIEKNINFQVTQVSDCVIVSSEVSPAGAINIVSYCWGAVINLLPKGIMCRGYITRGSVFHAGTQIIGSGYQEAFDKEGNVEAFKQSANERGTPFVEVDPVILKYIDQSSDACVKEMFGRMVKREGDTAALFPFKRLSHSFGVGGMFGKFDPEREKQSNQVMREMLHNFKERVMSYIPPDNERAIEKANHYIRALDAQLEECDETDNVIDRLCDDGVTIRGSRGKSEPPPV